MQVIIAIIGGGVGALILYILSDPRTVDKAQEMYAEEKLSAYLELTRMLRDGRNPHGYPSEIDLLPVHRDSVSFATWWRKVDDYYQANIILFDTTSIKLYHQLNELTLRQQVWLNENPSANMKLRHNYLKDSLVEKVRALDEWFKIHLDEKYGIEEGK